MAKNKNKGNGETEAQARVRESQEAIEQAMADARANSNDGSTSEADSASDVAATEAAGKITKARAEAEGDAGGPDNPDKTRPGDQTSVDATPPDAPKKGSKKFDVRTKFLDLSGYEDRDVLAVNDSRRTVVTSNGGKYEVSPKGTRLRKLSGPDTPEMIAAAQEEEDDE